VVAATALRERHAVKDDALEELVDGAKANLKYAEVVFREQPERLTKLGWGRRRNGSTLEAPGEVRDIRVAAEGDTWVVLEWRPPVDGGAVGAYKIQRKKKDGVWEDVGSSVDTGQMLSNQPRGIEMEYRVLAVNKAGTGQPSATVTVVL
jgi:fibronectin type 3 domain-containing protein